MTTVEEMARLVHRSLSPIVEPLHECFSAGSEAVDQYLPNRISGPDYAWYRTHSLRAMVRTQLEDRAAELGDWMIGGNPKRNGELQLFHKTDALVMRVLRDGRAPRLLVPSAGHSAARRAFWSNDPLAGFEAEDLFGKTQQTLLMLWQELGEGQFEIRVVRPIGHGSFNKGVKTDMQIELAPVQTDFENLAFEVENEEALFWQEIAEEEQEENGGGTW
jgi:hypothetical protein